MVKLILNVPVVAQEKLNTCWHASAQMIWLYWQGRTGKQGPMFTIPDKWARNNPVAPADFIRLAQNVGLLAVPRANCYNNKNLIEVLQKHGPIWCAGYWYGRGHVIVLTGVDGETVFINDPDRGCKKQGTVKWFNDKLANNLHGCIMCKDPKRY